MDAFTPAQTTELISRIGTKKARMRIDKMFINSFFGGCLISFGCAASLSTNSSTWFLANAAGLLRTISAMIFPVGLIMTILTGADLFTSYCLYSTVACLHRRISILDLLKTWVVSFLGNLAGCLVFTIVIVGYGGIFEAGAYKTETLTFATAKAVTPQWHQIFLRGILANWLVCVAVFLAVSSREIISKIVAIWFPVMCFVALGTDHVIANMFFMPLAIFEGHPDITVGYYIWKSMIPSGLGNIIGGGLFVGVVYWYLYLAGNEVEIHFDTNPADTAMFEQGGPISRNTSIVPDSGNMAVSGVGAELRAGNGAFKREGGSDSSA